MNSGNNSRRVLTIKEYTVEVVIGETDGLPLVDPVRPFDWSKKPNAHSRATESLSTTEMILWSRRSMPRE